MENLTDALVVDDNMLKNDKDYLQKILKLALNDLLQMKEKAQIIYGTSFGSIGVISEIPERTYKVLEVLTKAMEKAEVSFYGRLSRAVYRSARTESLK